MIMLFILIILEIETISQNFIAYLILQFYTFECSRCFSKYYSEYNDLIRIIQRRLSQISTISTSDILILLLTK